MRRPGGVVVWVGVSVKWRDSRSWAVYEGLYIRMMVWIALGGGDLPLNRVLHTCRVPRG